MAWGLVATWSVPLNLSLGGLSQGDRRGSALSRAVGQDRVAVGLRGWQLLEYTVWYLTMFWPERASPRVAATILLPYVTVPQSVILPFGTLAGNGSCGLRFA